MIEMKVTGRVGNVRKNKTNSGKDVVNFSVVSEKIVTVDNEKKVIDEWVNCTRWLREGEKFPFVSGDEVTLRGEPAIETYKDKMGEFKVSLNLNVKSLMLGF